MIRAFPALSAVKGVEKCANLDTGDRAVEKVSRVSTSWAILCAKHVNNAPRARCGALQRTPMHCQQPIHDPAKGAKLQAALQLVGEFNLRH